MDFVMKHGEQADRRRQQAPNAETYRERAQLCFRLADTTDDAWVRDALMRFGADMLQIAQELELIAEPAPPTHVPA